MTEDQNKPTPEEAKKFKPDLLKWSAAIIAGLASVGLLLSLYDNTPNPTTTGETLISTDAIGVKLHPSEQLLTLTVPPHAYVANLEDLCYAIGAEFPNDCTSALSPLENKGPFGDRQVEVVLPVEDGMVILGGFMDSKEPLIEFVNIMSTAQAGDRYTVEDLTNLSKKIGNGTITLAAVSAALWLARTGYRTLSAAKQRKLEQQARANALSLAKHKPSSVKPEIPTPSPVLTLTSKLLKDQPTPTTIASDIPTKDIVRGLNHHITTQITEAPITDTPFPDAATIAELTGQIAELKEDLYRKAGSKPYEPPKKSNRWWLKRS